jgi:hypothetical protein
MAVSFDTNIPLPYKEWVANQDTLNSAIARQKYNEYLISWYATKGLEKNEFKDSLKQNYIQLVKDLSFLFGQKEKDQFLADIDYKNEEELIFAIPFFAKKLKEISIVLSRKREAVKEAKLRYNLVGSNNALEKLLYEYILRGFTNTEGSITQVPASPILNLFPDLSAVKDNFFIEVEELHDANTYFDSDPSVGIDEYVNIESLVNTTPFEGFSSDEIRGILSTRFLPKISENPLSRLFAEYVTNQIREDDGELEPELPFRLANYNFPENNIPTDTTSLSSLSALIYNQIEASQKYLGENVYGLTAVRLKDVYQPDEKLTIDLQEGNSWFLWPSGTKNLDNLQFVNTFEPIPLNKANFLDSGATAGSGFDVSDLIFTEKNGVIEGAWFNGEKIIQVDDSMNVRIERQTQKTFIFPFPGFNLSSKGNNFLGYNVRDDIFDKFNLLDSNVKKELLQFYYTTKLPLCSVEPIYLNQTNLPDNGAYAGVFSNQADTITKYQKQTEPLAVYDEVNRTPIEEAFLYKFENTDLPITSGINNILWPVLITNKLPDLPITIQKDTALPILLSEVNVPKTMQGAVAGRSFEESDIIYKLSNKSSEPIEAAWLGTQGLDVMDYYTGSTQVYFASAEKCAEYVDGPVQFGLFTKINPSEKVSFVWGDRDTPLDEVIKFIEHADYCPYGKKSHNYYGDQDYLNTTPIFTKDYWKECNCKSVIFSPIGHIGDRFTDYNAITDFIFADPEGVGVDFAINTWKDSRNLDYSQSPQFAFYQLNQNNPDGLSLNDNPIGWGRGKWKNPTNTPFILKTGRRYTYSRSSFRKNKTDVSQSPYLIVKYPYKKVLGYIYSNQPIDLVVLVDQSKSQLLDLPTVKEILVGLIQNFLGKNKLDIQISFITFGTTASVLTYLSKDQAMMDLYLSSVSVSEDPQEQFTNVYDALQLAQFILNYPSSETEFLNVRNLCSKLNYTIANPVLQPQAFNIPNPKAQKKILVLTNGDINILQGTSEELFESESDKFEAEKRTLDLADTIKKQNVDIYVADIGEYNSQSQEFSIKLASRRSLYFNLKRYLVSGDGKPEDFVEYVAYRLNNQVPLAPSWNKAIRSAEGGWVGVNDASDMFLNPGDYLIYVHQGSVIYRSTGVGKDFTTPALDFTINMKLDGWDYLNNYFTLSAVGPFYGGKPFWAKVYTDIDKNNNFHKETSKFSGNPRYVKEYVRVTQPEISTMLLKTGDELSYKRYLNQNLTWNQQFTFNVTLSPLMWKKIKFTKELSSLKDLIKNNPYEYVSEITEEPSDIILESYSSFNPSYYNYYARKSFKYSQDLFLNKRCEETFVVYNTAATIVPDEPYANISNIHFPTVATVPIPINAVSKKQVGEYLLPDKLGVSTYRGKGYTISIDNDNLSMIDEKSERLFLDLGKYGPRNRGLTKKDQITPTKISSIDSRWMYEPYGRGKRSGVIDETKEDQKFTPYQTTYEVEKEHKFGVTRTTDLFQFWTPPIPPTWNQPDLYPLTFRKELTPENYEKRKERLLVNEGELVEWRTDLFGYDYGLYKQTIPSSLPDLDIWFKSDFGTLKNVNPNINAVNGEPITRWLNKKGGISHFDSYKSLFSTEAPILTSNYINGKPALYFNGNANMLFPYLLTNQNELTIFVVGQFLNVGTTFAQQNYQPMVSISLSSGLNYQAQYFNNETFSLYSEYGNNAFGYGNSYLDSVSPTMSGTPIKLNYSKDGIAELQFTNNKVNLFEFSFRNGFSETFINKQYYLNTTDYGKSLNLPLYSSVGVNNSGGLWIGSYGGGQYPTECAIMEIFIFKRFLTNKEKIDMRNYIFKEYNL